MKQSPLQQVKERFESKEKLVGKVMDVLKRPADTSKDEFKKKLQAQSNRKLMVLLEREKEIKERFGGRVQLIDTLVKARMGKNNKEDKGLRKHFEKFTNGRLLDLTRHKKI